MQCASEVSARQRFIVFSFQDQPPFLSYLMVAGRIKCSILKENMIETSQTLTFETLIFENIINISNFSVYHLSLIFIFLVGLDRNICEDWSFHNAVESPGGKCLTLHLNWVAPYDLCACVSPILHLLTMGWCFFSIVSLHFTASCENASRPLPEPSPWLWKLHKGSLQALSTFFFTAGEDIEYPTFQPGLVSGFSDSDQKQIRSGYSSH